MAAPYQNSLSIRERGKSVPYWEHNGRVDLSFRDLKGHPELLAELPGLDDDHAFCALLRQLNAWGTGLFTVASACEGLHHHRGHRHTGYVEFALNSKSSVGSTANLNRLLRYRRFTRAKFAWEIEEAEFTDANVTGFTCAVFVDTDFVESAAAARQDWETALDPLSRHLGAMRGPEVDPIYGLPHDHQPLNGHSISDPHIERRA